MSAMLRGAAASDGQAADADSAEKRAEYCRKDGWTFGALGVKSGIDVKDRDYAWKAPMRKPPDDGTPFPRRFCGKCYYNLHGIEANRCPECGTEFESQ